MHVHKHIARNYSSLNECLNEPGMGFVCVEQNRSIGRISEICTLAEVPGSQDWLNSSYIQYVFYLCKEKDGVIHKKTQTYILTSM